MHIHNIDLSNPNNNTTDSTRTRIPPSRRRQSYYDHEQPPYDHDEDLRMSCLHQILQLISNTFHVALILTGLSCLIYGIFISFHLPDPQRAMGSILEFYSSILLTAGIFGFLGTYRASCHRLPLKVSYQVATIISMMNFSIMFLLLLEKHSFLRYIHEKQNELYLSSEDVEYIEHHFNNIYYIFLGFSMAEIVRFYLDRRLYAKFQQYDIEVRQEMQYRRSRGIQESRRRWENEDVDSRSGLMTPLLLPKEELETQHESNPNSSSWWEEDPEDADPNENNPSSTSHSGWRLNHLLLSPLKTKSDQPSQNMASTSSSQNDEIFMDEESVLSVSAPKVENASIDTFDTLDGEMSLPDTHILPMWNHSDHSSPLQKENEELFR